ncbi:DUF5709 domain-containing protein [Streptomyces sp. NPDC049970]|uniref:DUF5709 domain-containing protein n=1 Tax=Streptomyces sp. NPDC049970 TaxID=3155033 RepID=UPI0034127417
MTADARGDEVPQPQEDDGSGPSNDALDLENTLDERDLRGGTQEGCSPPERPLVVNRFGTSGAGVHRGGSMGRRLAQENGDVGQPDGDGIGAPAGSEREPRAGGLSASGDAAGRENPVFAENVGIDGGAVSAQEAVVRVMGAADIQGRAV